MIGAGPIRISQDEWIVMRDSPRFPAALISRQHTQEGHEYFRVVTFALKSEERKLIGRRWTLEEANDLVLYSGADIRMPLPPPVDTHA